MDCDEKRRHRILLGNDMFCTCKTLKNYKNVRHFIFLVLEMIKEEEPFTALGYFPVEKPTFITIVSSLVAYLIVMIQFK